MVSFIQQRKRSNTYRNTIERMVFRKNNDLHIPWLENIKPRIVPWCADRKPEIGYLCGLTYIEQVTHNEQYLYRGISSELHLHPRRGGGHRTPSTQW